MGNTSKTILAALGGAIVGAGIALLFAPKSGKETREDIANKLSDAKDAIGEKGKELLAKTSTIIKDAKEEVVNRMTSEG